jgi:hypothetical protein
VRWRLRPRTAQTRRERADAFADAGTTLAAASQQAIDTGTYMRAAAATSAVGTHLLRADAAALSADAHAIAAPTTAAPLQTRRVADERRSRFVI